MTPAWDVHIGYLPPSRWDDLADHDARARRSLAGHELRPGITIEPIAWESLHMTPRWIGDDTSAAVAAIEPSMYHKRGADEWQRFLAGTRCRGEVALAVSMIGAPKDPTAVSFSGLFGPAESVSLPGGTAFCSVGGDRVALAEAPTPAPGLGPADRDLALRLVNAHEKTPQWWSLHLNGTQAFPGDGGGAGRVIDPSGSLLPLLITGAREVVAAVWISPEQDIRHYIIPWLPAWATVLDWLGQRAVPEFVPSASRRMHGRLGEDPGLQTTAESSAQAELAQLDAEHRQRRETLEQNLQAARAAAQDVRFDLLFGSGVVLERGVARVLRDAGCTVTSIDDLLGQTVSADLLVEYQAQRQLVEVKSASGNAPERLVEATRKHLDTWPVLRPNVDVAGITLIVNHQTNSHPSDRTAQVYARLEFVQSLTIPVVSTLALFHAWRRGDLTTIRAEVFGDTAPANGSSPDARPIPPSAAAGDRRARRWPWRR